MNKIKKFFQEYREHVNEPELDAQGNPVDQVILLKSILIGGGLTFCFMGLFFAGILLIHSI